jgi:hypothetical protein
MARYEPYHPVDTLSPAAQALVAYIRDQDYVTYAEMPRILRPFIPTEGEGAIVLHDDPNIVFWTGITPEWVHTLRELTEADLIWRQPCTVLSYLVDGAMLQMPLAKRPPKQGYATPHWAPACFRPIEHIAPKERQRYGRSA